jgi:hypothetical protein
MFHPLYASKCSIIIISATIDPSTRSGRHLHFSACLNAYATISAGGWCGDLAQGDGLVTLTTSQATSDIKSKKEASQESDNRNHRVQFGIRCVPLTTLSAVRKNHKQSVNVGEVSALNFNIERHKLFTG